MLSFTILTVATAGGALVAGAKTLRDQKKKKEMPWTYRAQKLNRGTKSKSLFATSRTRALSLLTSRKEKISTQITSYQEELDTKYQQVFRSQIDPLFGRERHQQLKELTSGEPLEISDEEKEANRYLVLSLGAVGTSIIGTMFFPPLLFGTLLLGLSISRRVYKQAHKSWKESRRIKIDHLAALYVTAVWFGGYFVAGAIGALFISISDKLAIVTEDRSRKSLINIFGQQPRSVWVLTNEACPDKGRVEVEIPFEQLQIGDTLVLHAGQVIPSDGTIIKGHASIDQRMLTGESQPFEAGVNDQVFASTTVLAGKIYVRVEKAGKDTTAAQIGEILNQTANYKISLESKAMTFANNTIFPMLGLSGMAWALVGVQGAIAMIGANCTVNFMMLGPISMLNFLNIAAAQGILVKDGRVLEELNEIDTVVFDKTGTLTVEQPTVSQIYTYNGILEDELLALAAAAEYRQTHPIAKAILSAAEARHLELPLAANAQYEIGYGIRVQLSQQMIHVGSHRFMKLSGISVPKEVQALQVDCHERGNSLVMVAIDAQLVGAIELRPTIRTEVKQVVKELQQRNLSLVIISGDQEGPTRELAKQLGIQEYFANTLPERKADLIKELQQEGRRICFVGDGINDALALRAADVSISLRGATTVATDTAQIVLMDGTLRKLLSVFTLAQDFNGNITANLMTSIGASLFCASGIFFLHFGIMATELLYSLSVLAGLGIAGKPLLDHKMQQQQDSRIAV